MVVKNLDRLWERLSNERRLPLRIGMSWCHAALQPSVQSASGLKVQVVEGVGEFSLVEAEKPPSQRGHMLAIQTWRCSGIRSRLQASSLGTCGPFGE